MRCNKRHDYSITLLAPLRNDSTALRHFGSFINFGQAQGCDRLDDDTAIGRAATGRGRPNVSSFEGASGGIRCSGFYLPIPHQRKPPEMICSGARGGLKRGRPYK